MTDTLEQVAGLVLRETGIELRAAQRTALRAAIGRVTPGLDPAGFLRLTADHVTRPAAVARLVDEVTVKETSLFRNPAEFQKIDWSSLGGPLGAGSRTGRVWSAGCATGEEVYTLALLAAEALGHSPPPVYVLGTDISDLALARARAGVYGVRAASVLSGPRGRYFHLDWPSATVGDELRAMVAFRHHNLSRDPSPPPGEDLFDLVVCRNVLIYFSADAVERAVTTLQAALRPGGTLILGASDMLAAGPVMRRRGQPTPGVRVEVAESRTRPAPRAARRRARASTPPVPLTPSVPPTPPVRPLTMGEVSVLPAPGSGPEADEWYVRGLRHLDAGEPGAAAESLRRALYLDSRLALAAFALGNAYEVMGDRGSARRSYARALLSLDRGGESRVPPDVTAADVALACAHRLKALAP